MEDRSAHIPEEKTCELGREKGRPGRPLAPETHALRGASFDTRIRGSTRPLLEEGMSKLGREVASEAADMVSVLERVKRGQATFLAR